MKIASVVFGKESGGSKTPPGEVKVPQNKSELKSMMAAFTGKPQRP